MRIDSGDGRAHRCRSPEIGFLSTFVFASHLGFGMFECYGMACNAFLNILRWFLGASSRVGVVDSGFDSVSLTCRHVCSLGEPVRRHLRDYA